VNVNGKTDGSRQVDLELIQQDMLPENAPENKNITFTSRSGLLQDDVTDYGNTTEHGDRSMGTTNAQDELTDNRFVGDISHIGSAGTTAERADALLTGNLHQNESVEDNLLANPSPTDTTMADYPVQKADESDFAHRFTTADTPFVVAENDYYNLTADRMRNRLYLTVFRSWDEPSDVMELGAYFSRIAPLMTDTFTLLNDLTALQPDESGTLMAPGLPNKDVLLNAGLVKVADLVPYECDTLVHGLHSFSVNSLRLRYFKDRSQAEHWLGDDYRETGTPEDMDLN
jgi:hypothetical protein